MTASALVFLMMLASVEKSTDLIRLPSILIPLQR